MNERFTRFRKIDLIKMWRTLKVESGYRKCTTLFDDCTLEELMNRHEERVIDEEKP